MPDSGQEPRCTCGWVGIGVLGRQRVKGDPNCPAHGEPEQPKARGEKLWSVEFTDATGLFYAEIQVDSPEPPYPAQVTVECETGTLLDYDARALGRLLIQAADECDRRNRA